MDVLNYRFEVDLNDTTDVIRGSAQVDIMFRTHMSSFYLDLKNLDGDGTGMMVSEVLVDGRKANLPSFG